MSDEKLFWEFSELSQMHIELTNACNAACPMCVRLGFAAILPFP